MCLYYCVSIFSFIKSLWKFDKKGSSEYNYIVEFWNSYFILLWFFLMFDVSSDLVELLSATDWLEKLRNQFKDGRYRNMDYWFFSPKKSFYDTKKYPLIIFIHGLAHGWHERSQIDDSYFPYMISEEIQSKFREWWAHVLLPRIPEYMFDVFYTSKIQWLINSYVKKYEKNIDMDQIYIMWSSAGGWMAWRLLIRNPKFYSKALITCANKLPSKKQLKVVSDKPIWLVAAKKDPIIPFFSQKMTWNRLKRFTKLKKSCRFTVFKSKVYCPDGKKLKNPHLLSKVISYDFCMLNKSNPVINYDWVNYPGTETILATDEKISTNGIINWLQNF